jgi:hypothetical protein
MAMNRRRWDMNDFSMYSATELVRNVTESRFSAEVVVALNGMIRMLLDNPRRAVDIAAYALFFILILRTNPEQVIRDLGLSPEGLHGIEGIGKFGWDDPV